MHPSRAFQTGDDTALMDEAAAIGFARIFAGTPAGPRVAHAPMLRVGNRFRFHLANANALCATLNGTQALALFEGPNGYLSANWYADISSAVPTWNYIAIECEGYVRSLGRDALVELVDGLAAILEPRVGENWTRGKMDTRRFDAMLGAITAFELVVEEVRGTHKLSQNKSREEIKRIVAGYERSGQSAMAEVVRNAHN